MVKKHKKKTHTTSSLVACNNDTLKTSGPICPDLKTPRGWKTWRISTGDRGLLFNGPYHPCMLMCVIFTYIYHKNIPNVGKYTSPMDGMGEDFHRFFFKGTQVDDYISLLPMEVGLGFFNPTYELHSPRRVPARVRESTPQGAWETYPFLWGPWPIFVKLLLPTCSMGMEHLYTYIYHQSKPFM